MSEFQNFECGAVITFPDGSKLENCIRLLQLVSEPERFELPLANQLFGLETSIT